MKGVSKAYQRGKQRVDVLRGIDLEVEQGEFLALMGQSGSVKTTLLNLIGGLDRSDRGEVTVALDEPGPSVHGVQQVVGHVDAVERLTEGLGRGGVALDDLHAVAPLTRRDLAPVAGEHADPVQSYIHFQERPSFRFDQCRSSPNPAPSACSSPLSQYS